MLEFLSRAAALILEDADVFETAVALQILNTLRHQAQELFQFGVAGIPQMAIVMGVFEQKLVRTDRSHAVIQTVAPATGFAFDPIDRRRVNDGSRRPWAAIRAGQGCDHLELRALATKGTRSGAGSRLGDIVSRDHPRTGDRIFAEFHK